MHRATPSGTAGSLRVLTAVIGLAVVARPHLALAQPLDPIVREGRLLMAEIYDAGSWLARVPYRLALPYVARRRVRAYVDGLPLPADVRRRVEARIDSRDFVDEIVPFVLALQQTYVASAEAAGDDFDAWLRQHFRPEDRVPGIEHSMFRWAASPPRGRGGFALDPEIAGLLVGVYDALYLQDVDPGAPLGDQLACDRQPSDDEARRLATRLAPTVRRLLELARDRLGDRVESGDIGDAIAHVLAATDRLEGVTVSVIDLLGDEVCKHYRVFATRVLRETALRSWMLRELDQPGGGRLWDFLRYIDVRPHAVLIVVDGLQGHLVEALARGERTDPFVRAIAAEQKADAPALYEGPPTSAAPAQSTRFLRELAAHGFRHPAYLPFFRRLYAESPSAIAQVGVSTTPTISVRNIPIALTGAPVAGPGGTGIPNFHFVDRTLERDGRRVGRPWYFYGNDAIRMEALMRASGMRTLFDRLPALGSFSCAAQLDRGAHYTVDGFLNLAVGERLRDFAEVLCLPELARRAGNEIALRETRTALLAKEPALARRVPWWRWVARRGQHDERVLARRQIDRIAALEQEAMPELLVYYNPWPDHFAHFKGPFSDEIIAPSGELNRLDYWLGRLDAAYTDAGLDAHTLFAMAGDHGLTPVFRVLNPETVVFDALRAEGVDFRVVKISSDEGEGPKLTNRLNPPAMTGIDVVVASTAGGNYMLDLFADQGARWAEQPVLDDLLSLRPLASTAPRIDLIAELRRRLGDSLDYLVVRETPCTVGGGSVRLVANRGGQPAEATVVREGDRVFYAFDRVDLLDTGVLSHYETLDKAAVQRHATLRARCLSRARRDDPSTWCREAEWRELTSYTPRPDAVVQIAHLYDTDRAGTINLFPRAGIGYNTKVPGRHAGESFHEKDAFVGLWGTPVIPQERLRTAVNGSAPIAVYEWLTGNAATPGDGFAYPSLRSRFRSDEQ